MTFRELFREESFKSIFHEVEEFANGKLSSYVNGLGEEELREGSKEIFDAVWGNIEFSNGEIYILDSPLLQRLRKIRQLGLAYFVYCGSDYSRFYHTIGVVYLADRMVTAINRSIKGTEEKQKAYFKMVARLAAIFHDTGHMFLSHVSEHYFAKSPLYPRGSLVEKMLSDFEKKTGKTIALHELLSCMIVNTDIVAELLKKVNPFIGKEISLNQKTDELVEYISSFITGVPVDKKILPYSSIINGPIDADKCDYLSRDSHVTRVPVAVDISRITQKLSVVKVEDINTSQLWHDSGNVNDAYYELAMKDSAEKALFQLCIARTIMFDSVYYHHKVLTAETEFRSVINRMANLKTPVFTSFTEILEYTDEDFNKYFFATLKEGKDSEEQRNIDEIWQELQRLYERELAKRIACFMPDFLDGGQGEKEKLYDDILTHIDSTEEVKFIRGVREEYQTVCRLLDKPEKQQGSADIFVIQAPTNIFGHSKIRVPIDLQNGSKRDFKGYELVSSRETSSSASYIVTGENDRHLVLLALEKVLQQEYQIKLKNEAIACGKFNGEELSKTREKLFLKGYYDKQPSLIDEATLSGYISNQKIKEIKEKFSSFEGQNGFKLSCERIKKFFRQVLACCSNKQNCRDIVDGIYVLLNRSIYINREYIAEHLNTLIEKTGNSNEHLYVVPLGSYRDSGKHMMYFWNDLKKPNKEIETEKSLEELLRLPKLKQIVFFDDGSFSGTQLVSIIQEYMGVNKKTKEHHVDELPDNLKKKIIFFFIAFNSAKEPEIRKELEEIGLKNVEFVWAEDMSKRWLDDRNDILKDTTQKELVKEFLKEIGIEILRASKMVEGQYKEGWSEERIQTSALGYNDAQQMVFLKSSVPTYTITAFYRGGEYHGMIWEPLLPRTEK